MASKGVELLYEAMRARGLSRYAAARELNVDQAQVSRWLSGQATPNLRSILKIAKVFGIPVEVWDEVQ